MLRGYVHFLFPHIYSVQCSFWILSHHSSKNWFLSVVEFCVSIFFFGPAHGKWAEPIYAGYSPQVCARFIRTDCQPDKIRVRFSFLVSLAVFLPDHQFNFCHNFFSYLFTSSLLSNARPPHTRGLLATFRSCPAIY